MIEWKALLEPALVIGFAPIIFTFAAATVYQIYISTQLRGEVSFKEITQQRTAEFVNSNVFTGLVWASLLIAAFVVSRNLATAVAEQPYLHVIIAAVLGMAVKTIVELVGWKQEDKARYTKLTAIQWVLALVAALIGAALAG